MALVVKIMLASAEDARDLGSTPESGRPLKKGHDNQLQYSCLDNPHGQRSLAGLQSMGSQTVGHNQSDLQCMHCEMK